MKRFGFLGWFEKLLNLLGLGDEAVQFQRDQDHILHQPIHFRPAQAQLVRISIILLGGFLWATFAFGLFSVSRTPVRPVSIQIEPLKEHVRFVLYELRFALIPPGFKRGNSLQERWNAYQEHILKREPDAFHELDRELFALPFTALFSAHVFRHVWTLAFAFWLAYRIASHYVTDVFDLNSVPDGERFLLQSAFGSAYNVLNIQDGDVPEREQTSNLYKIGGPGYVRVHLENAALFETFERDSRIIHPTGDQSGGVVLLLPFERLRKVIDLRDQVMRVDTDGRTRDGIPVRAENLRVMFSIHRPPGALPTLKQPYPFDDQAFNRLIYFRPGDRPWTSIMEVEIRSNLWDFFIRHKLDEFLANIGAPEIDQTRHREEILRWEAEQAGGDPSFHQIDTPGSEQAPVRGAGTTVTDSATGNGQPPPKTPSFLPRPEITRLFYDSSDGTQDQPLVDLKWIDVGTWVLPHESILSRHQEAWRLSNENLLQSSPSELNKVRRDNAVVEGLRLIQEVTLITFNQSREAQQTAYQTMMNLLQEYRDELMEALELYEKDGAADSPPGQRLQAVLNFLSRLVDFHWTVIESDESSTGSEDSLSSRPSGNSGRPIISVVIQRDENELREDERQALRSLIARQTGASEDEIEILFEKPQ